MTAQSNDRDWQAFMSSALGLCVAENGPLIDHDPPTDLTTWAPPAPAEPTAPAPADG
ncbi:hypothetical protein [Streptacidiphilus sp. EB103A]|uniref:hypothetical protein n=1 Tax=Streptacidiphilus sp. EB103A TaxID=3156275 RepID=UPI003513E186